MSTPANSATAKHKVLLLSPFFFPEPISTGKYNTYLARGLAEAGAEVEALASFPLYPTWKPSSTQEQLPNVLTHRGGLKIKYPSSTYGRRAVLEIWYLLFVARFLFKRKDFTKIVAVFPPSLFMWAVPLLSRSSVPIVGIVHDLQGVYANRGGGALSRLVKNMIGLVEKRAFAACDHLIFLSEAMRATASEEYGLDLSRSSVHYPFVNIAPYNPERPQLDYIFKGAGPTLVYSGALGEKQAPEQLLELFVKALDANESWSGVIISQGPAFERLKQKEQHPRLRFYPLVEESALAELLERSTIQMIPQQAGTSGGSLPSKLPNIIAANTKLFCITDASSEIESIVQKYLNGAVSTTWRMEQCLATLQELMTQAKAPITANHSFADQFSLEGLVSRVLSAGKGHKNGE